MAALAAKLDPAAVDVVLERMDRRLAWIDEQELPEGLVPRSTLQQGPDRDAAAARCKSLVRKATRSLYATGCYIDMPDEMKAHPGVQAKISSLHKDMDDAVLGITEMLEQLTPSDHRNLRRCLSEDAGFTERLAHYLERPAIEDDLPFKRRFGMRASLLQLGNRMTAQSPALVIDPIVRKVRRIQARPRSEAEQLRMRIAQVGEEAFWAHQEKMAGLHAAWAERLAAEPPVAPATSAPNASAPRQWSPSEEKEKAPAPKKEPEPRGQSAIDNGGIILAAGVGSVLLGLGFWGLASLTSVEGFLVPAVILGVTVGPILLVIGLVALLVGLGMKAAG